MPSRSRITLAAVLATAALGPAPSLAHADANDLRGEHSASLSAPAAVSATTDDLRTEAAAARSSQPVIVDVENPASTGFDWTSAVIGLAGGLAIAVLAGVGAGGGRRRHAPARIA